MSTNTLRAAPRAKFGDRQYRITRDDEIHVYGTMPNTNATGWYVERLIRLDVL
jgi:hypothetical protein